MVRRSTTGNNRNVISKRLRVAMTRAKDDLHLMVPSFSLAIVASFASSCAVNCLRVASISGAASDSVSLISWLQFGQISRALAQ